MFSILAANSWVESNTRCTHAKSEPVTSLCVPGDSEGDEEETTQDEVSSHTSEEDGGVVKVEKELENAEQPVGGVVVARSSGCCTNSCTVLSSFSPRK